MARFQAKLTLLCVLFGATVLAMGYGGQRKLAAAKTIAELDFVVVGCMGDMIYVAHLLEKHHVSTVCSGSVVYAVQVKRGLVPRALRIVHADQRAERIWKKYDSAFGRHQRRLGK